MQSCQTLGNEGDPHGYGVSEARERSEFQRLEGAHEPSRMHFMFRVMRNEVLKNNKTVSVAKLPNQYERL